MNQEREFRATVSSLGFEGKSIFVWVQRNPISVRNLEITLPSHCASGWALPVRSPADVQRGCKYFCIKDKKYLRVLVKDIIHGDVLALAIDYGVEFWTDYCNLMLPSQNDPYIDESDLAEKLYVAGLTINRPLNSSEVLTVVDKVCQVKWSIRIEERRLDQTLASFHNGTVDLKEVFASMGLMETQQAWMNTSNVRNHAQTMPISTQPQKPIAEPVKDARFINPSPIPVSVIVDVTVTDSAEGPWGFTVQKDDDRDLLTEIEEAMQKADKDLLEKPFFLGQTCLAYCPLKVIYARGLIVGMTGPKVNVNFVDYGCNAILGSKDLFKLPAFGLRTPMLGHRFLLAGLNDIKIKDDDKKLMIDVFREIVNELKLVLLAVPAEDEGVQICELYARDTNTNVKKILNLRMKLFKLKYSSSEWPTIGQKVPAFICHVESADLFYVQVNENVDELQELIQDVAKSAQNIKKDSAKVNMPCLALFSDELWYRAVIKQIVGTNLEVFFVDYGNSHVVTLSSVKEIPEKLVLSYKTHAIPCAVASEEQFSSQELKSKLEAAANEDNFEIQVTFICDDKLIVKLLKNGVDYFKPPKSEQTPMNENGFKRFDTNGNQNETYGVQSNGEKPETRQSHWRSENAESSGGFNDGSGRRRFDDNQNSFRSNRRGENEESGGGFNNDNGRRRFDDNQNTFRSNRRGENGDSGGGFKSSGERNRFDDTRENFRSNRREESGESDTGFRNRGGNKFGDGDRGSGNKFGDGDRGGGNKFGDSDRPRRQPIRNEDRISPGDTFPEPTINPEQTEDVIVTAYVSPHEFYVQTQAGHAEFLELMNELQVDYTLKFGFKRDQPPQESDPVIAEFSEDRIHYRATVMEAEPLTVRFVDYGNFEAVRDSRNVYPVMKKYADMPIQAVKCTLKGVKSIGDDWSTEIAEHFDKETLRCCFHENVDGTYVVSLSFGEIDLATDLIARNLVAADSDQPAGEPTTLPEPLPEKSTEFAAIDLPLLPGQVVVASIPFIFSFHSFFIHLQPESVTKMASLIADYVLKGDLAPIGIDDLRPNGMCLIPLEGDDAKYRGRIVEIGEGDLVSLQYMDYGDTCELTRSELLSLPEELASIPALAVECCLFGDSTSLTDDIQDQFKNECEGVSFIVDVKSVQDEKLSVVLYDLTGRKISVQEGINEAPVEAPLPTLPLLTRDITAEIIDFVEPSTVLIKLPHISPPELEQFYAGVDDNEDVDIGALCAVKTADGSWYRARRLNETQAYLCDNGGTEEFLLIRKLVPECLVMSVAVAQVKASWLFFGQSRVRVTRSQIDEFIIEPIEKLAVISHIESANDIFVQPQFVTEEWINSALVDTVAGERSDDKIFAARFPDDEQWYRAEIFDEETLTVKFIDYGNTSVVTEVAPLPRKMKLISPQAVAIHFEGTLLETAMSLLEELQANGTLLTLAMTNEGEFELFLNGFNLMGHLSGLLPLAVEGIVHICHAEGPELIFLQRDEDAPLLAKINEKLNSIELVPLAADPEPNQLVAAQFQVDEAWYRARVVGDQVIFVDHGNGENISEVRQLPEELKYIPALAQKAALHLPEGYKWTDDACEEVFNMIDVGFQIQEVSVVNGSYVVRLFNEDSDFAQKIMTEVGNDSEATTVPVADETPEDCELGRDLVDELVEDVISSFVEEEPMDPDASRSYDSGTFSKDLNSPPEKDEIENRPFDDELSSTVVVNEEVTDDALQVEESHDLPAEIVVVEDVADASIEVLCSAVHSCEIEEMDKVPVVDVSDSVNDVDKGTGFEDISPASVEIVYCDFDKADDSVKNGSAEVIFEGRKLNFESVGDDDNGNIVEDIVDANVAAYCEVGDATAAENEKIDGEEVFTTDIKKENFAKVDVISEKLSQLQFEPYHEEVAGVKVQVELIEQVPQTADEEVADVKVEPEVMEQVPPTADEEVADVKVEPEVMEQVPPAADEEVADVKVEAELIEQVAENCEVKVPVVNTEAALKKSAVLPTGTEKSEKLGGTEKPAEKPTPQPKQRLSGKVSSDEKIVPGSINRGVIFSEK